MRICGVCTGLVASTGKISIWTVELLGAMVAGDFAVVVLAGANSPGLGRIRGSMPNSAQPVGRLNAVARNAQTHLFVFVTISRVSRKDANEKALGSLLRELQRGKRPWYLQRDGAI